MKKDDAYYPSAAPGKRYIQYLKYLIEYAKFGDWKSIMSSFRLVLSSVPETESRIANSRLGKFKIRKGTTDFQFVNYAYESEIRNYLLSKVSEFDVFVDIGACIGEYNIWLAGMGIECHAFEPVPSNFECLKENIKINEVENTVSAYNFGLGEKEEKVYFDIMGTVTGSSHINRDAETEKANIDIKVLDKILSEDVIPSDKSIIMKLDVEGMEVEVLKGALNFIKRFSKLEIIFEHTFSGKNDVQELLESIGNFEFSFLDKYNIIGIKK